MRKIKIILCHFIILLFACNVVVFDEPQPAIDLRAQSSGNSFSNPVALQSIPDKFHGLFKDGKDSVIIFSDKIWFSSAPIMKMRDQRGSNGAWIYLGKDLVVIQDGEQYFFNISILTEEEFYNCDECIFEMNRDELYSYLDKWQCFELERKNENIQIHPFSYEMENVNLDANSLKEFEQWRYYKNNIKHVNSKYLKYSNKPDIPDDGVFDIDDVFDINIVLIEDVNYQDFWKLLKASKSFLGEYPYIIEFYQSIDSIQDSQLN